jgi:hypothetical protein
VLFIDRFSFRGKVLNIGMGTLLGSVYGFLQSNKQNAATIDELGPEYKLGRIASDERLQYDMKSGESRPS